VSLLTKILLMFVIAALLALLGVGTRGERTRISFPGPRIPESWITMFWLVSSIASYAGAVWFMIRGLGASSRDDIGAAFGLAFLGAMMAGTWLHRRRSRRDAA
jgi:hypothetical protein